MKRHVDVAGVRRHIKGWRPSPPNHQTALKTLVMRHPSRPHKADLSHLMPAVRDQGQLGSCTANATLEGMGFLYMKDGRPDPSLSRLYLYYWSRAREGVHADEDSGAMLHDVAAVLMERGAPLESLWPYSDVNKPHVGGPFSAMPSGCDDDAVTRRLDQWFGCADFESIKTSIAEGYPVVVGVSCPANMIGDVAAHTGVIHYPKVDEEIVGGHAIILCGYDDSLQMVKFQNSWGTSWGESGRGYLPYRFFEGRAPLSSEAMTFRHALMP